MKVSISPNSNRRTQLILEIIVFDGALHWVLDSFLNGLHLGSWHVKTDIETIKLVLIGRVIGRTKLLTYEIIQKVFFNKLRGIFLSL